MTALPFSDQQRATLIALRAGRKTDAELRATVGLSKGGVIGVTKALHQRGLAKYAGRIGRGHWYLTALGEKAVAELAAEVA